VKVLKLLAASAILCGRTTCSASDLWVMRYVWDRQEQIEPLAALVNGVLKNHEDDAARHPLSAGHAPADAEDLARQLAAIEGQMDGSRLSLTLAARLRQQLADISDRAVWLADDQSRSHIMERAKKGLERLS
jgi:MoxR-like ATPase